MKKIITIVFSLIVCQCCIYAQNWTNLPGTWPQSINNFYEDTVNNRLLAYGGLDSVGAIQAQGIAAWDGNNWSRLPNWPTYPTNQGITVGSLVRHNGDLYMGCASPSWNSHCYLARYNGIVLDTFARFAMVYPTILLEYQNDLVVCSNWSNDSVNGTPFDAVARWDGTNWTDIGQGMFVGTISAGVVYHGAIYVSGFSAADQNPYVFRFSNGSWQIVGQQFSGIVFHLCVFNDELYAGSYNNQSSWGNAIMRLDTLTNTWEIPGGGLASTSVASWTQVDGMTVSNGALYIVGVFDHAGGVPDAFVTKWDGTQWCSLGVDLNTYQCRAIGTLRDTIYISTGIIFDNDSSDNFVEWIGGNYVDTCGFIPTGISEQSQQDFSMQVFPNPANNFLTIQINNTNEKSLDIKIIDVLGQTIIEKKEENISGNFEEQIDVSGLSAGFYFVSVQTGDKSFTQKIIIQK